MLMDLHKKKNTTSERNSTHCVFYVLSMVTKEATLLDLLLFDIIG